jgi:hypothetical protein
LLVLVAVVVAVVVVGVKEKCREQLQVVLLCFEGELGWVVGSALEVEGGYRLS